MPHAFARGCVERMATLEIDSLTKSSGAVRALRGAAGLHAADRAGARGGLLVGETLLAAAFGGVVIAVKYLLH